ncbi:hypothetical protein KIPB_007603 [Kipferlia bialata]|uniref:Uncharacterized protein n=1 Tax=Kipferlia bialata TaxID=797122 RepID=A0A9K3CZG3_9EUKA|nr:hypothetical protein KIPB_007603 [Kipferlia bialata]|eukprot:g7603.t1
MTGKPPRKVYDLTDRPGKDSRVVVRRSGTKITEKHDGLFSSRAERDARFPALVFLSRPENVAFVKALPTKQLLKFVARGQQEQDDLMGMIDDVENGRPRRP